MFLDQITSFEGTHLLQWNTIKSKFSITTRPKAKWIKILESLITTPTSRRLSPHLQSPPKDISEYMPDPDCPDMSRSSREWIAMWQPTSNSTVMGRIRHKNPITDTIVGQHYIEWLDHNTDTPTPHSSSPILIQCTGCHLDDPLILLPRTSRATCLFSGNASLTMIIDRSNVRLSNNKIQLVHQLPDLSELSYSHFEFMTSTMLIKRPTQLLPDSRLSHSLSQQLISKFIVQGSYQSKLAILASQLSAYNIIDFYTDGSLSHGGTFRMTMGIVSCCHIWQSFIN